MSEIGTKEAKKQVRGYSAKAVLVDRVYIRCVPLRAIATNKHPLNLETKTPGKILASIFTFSTVSFNTKHIKCMGYRMTIVNRTRYGFQHDHTNHTLKLLAYQHEFY